MMTTRTTHSLQRSKSRKWQLQPTRTLSDHCTQLIVLCPMKRCSKTIRQFQLPSNESLSLSLHSVQCQQLLRHLYLDLQHLDPNFESDPWNYALFLSNTRHKYYSQDLCFVAGHLDSVIRCNLPQLQLRKTDKQNHPIYTVQIHLPFRITELPKLFEAKKSWKLNCRVVEI